MVTRREEYRGHVIEVRDPAGTTSDAERAGPHGPGDVGYPDLLIDDCPVPYGRLPSGRYFIAEYAYDWREDLVDVARGLLDYESKADEEDDRGGAEGLQAADEL